MAYSKRARDAMILAFDLHADQTRKGSDVPYITHPLAVAAIVGEYGGGEDEFIAALLHDAVEDQGGRPVLDQIRARFGARVAEFVSACSDTDVSPKPPWKERKTAHIARVAGADPAVKLVLAADKLHNLLTIIAGLRTHSSALWDRFTGGRDGTLWYYDEMIRALSQNWDHPLLRELRDTVTRLQAALRELEAW